MEEGVGILNSYVADTDIFPVNASSGLYMEDGESAGYIQNTDFYHIGPEFWENIFTDNSFMGQVWNKTLGGALPFIFQPDKDNSNPDQFCFAKFDMNSLKVTQKAFKVYDVNLKIREVW